MLVDLVPLNTLFEKKLTQTNLRLEKSFPVGHSKLRAMVDLFNAFNGNGVITLNTRVNALYPLPTLVMPARMLKFSGQWDF